MNASLNVYLIFVVSWFLHLGTRLPALGIIRFDLLLVVVLFLLAVSRKTAAESAENDTRKYLKILIAYSVLTIPLVEWPGSVLNRGIQELVKAAVFYYFTVAFVQSEADLRKLLLTFVGCQLFRVMEPLYLHLTEGYWGDFASMANWEYLNRLSGAPSDIVNPNGLAFVICTALPFLYFLARLSWRYRLAFLLFAPLSIYALNLTASRTGFLGLVIITLGIMAKAKRRFVVIATVATASIVLFPMLSADMQDRYLSIFGKGEKNATTAEGRVEGWSRYLDVAMRRPVFGHGLGTSREANANFGSDDQVAHNLYLETAQEIGFVGLIIFLLFIKAIFTSFRRCKQIYDEHPGSDFVRAMVDAMQVWLFLNLVFSFASYGLTSYEWYLLGGFSVALTRLATQAAQARAAESVQIVEGTRA